MKQLKVGDKLSITKEDLEATRKAAGENATIEDLFDPEICPIFQAATRQIGDGIHNVGIGSFRDSTNIYLLSKCFTRSDLDNLIKGEEFHTTIEAKFTINK